MNYALMRLLPKKLKDLKHLKTAVILLEVISLTLLLGKDPS
jgi:hypothetical protein